MCQVQGDVLYNGKSFSEFVVERTSGYVEQIDRHYPPLTVRETLDFAAWCQGPGYRQGQPPSMGRCMFACACHFF